MLFAILVGLLVLPGQVPAAAAAQQEGWSETTELGPPYDRAGTWDGTVLYQTVGNFLCRGFVYSVCPPSAGAEAAEATGELYAAAVSPGCEVTACISYSTAGAAVHSNGSNSRPADWIEVEAQVDVASAVAEGGSVTIELHARSRDGCCEAVTSVDVVPEPGGLAVPSTMSLRLLLANPDGAVPEGVIETRVVLEALSDSTGSELGAYAAGSVVVSSLRMTTHHPAAFPPIELLVTTTNQRGDKWVVLSWDGADSTQVDVWRDGQLYDTTANDGSHTIHLEKGSSQGVYRVCEAGTTVCSADVAA